MIEFFFFNDTATTEIYTLSLHDALPISCRPIVLRCAASVKPPRYGRVRRSEEHTSELQSQSNLVCRLLLEKKKIATTSPMTMIISIDASARTCYRSAVLTCACTPLSPQH